jgi:PAS domain S-box-containing protein
VHTEDLPHALAVWQAALDGDGTYEVEFRLRRADGAWRWHLVRAVALRDDEGAITRWVGTNTDIHERKLAETEHALDRERLWNMSQSLMLVCDMDGRISAVNPSWTRIFGWSEAELIGHRLAEFIHPEDMPRTLVQTDSNRAGNPTVDFENRYRTRDGDWRLINWTAVPDDGRILAIGRDLTDERVSLRERERAWTLSPVAKLVAKSDGEILAVNPSWTRILGWPEDDTVGRNLLEFVISEDRAHAAAWLRQLASGGPVVEYGLGHRTAERTVRRISWTMVPENDRLYGFGRDVTAEAEAAAALAITTAERERIWSSTNDLMGTAGLDGFLKAINPAWNRLLGWSEAELLARPFMTIIDPADRPWVADTVKRIGEGEPADFEDWILHKDGARSLISWSCQPAGEVFHVVGRDVTAQRQAEEALRQSQKMEAVGQLTGGIAHDFNNLLQGITGSLDLLQKRITQGRIADLDRFITGAMNSANRAAALTHRLLAFSRRQPLDPRPVRVNPLVASMGDLLRRTLGERIDLDLVLAADLWSTHCDPNQLENAVLNLAINARDAMPDGGRLVIETANAPLDRIDAAQERDLRPGQYVSISVTDTGTGMTPDIVARAFEPFFTTKPTGQGTGLGLSMIYGFARQSDGHAKISSEPGKGTTVTLYLPRHRGDTEEDDQNPQLAAARFAETGESVLVIEDEPVVRGLIVEVLADLGYLAIEAQDGPTGLDMLRSARRIDLLITDMGLPGLNGRQVADAGRLLRPQLKVLFMTGYAETAAITEGFLEPGMAMITKPFAMEMLAHRIREIIEAR